MADFLMPVLGADMTEGTLTAWRKQPGDAIHRGDIIAVVETDKADVEVEVFREGVLERLLVAPGTTVPVGTPIAVIREEAAVGAAPPVALPPMPAVISPKPIPPRAPPPPGRTTEPGRATISPAARRLAAERGVDLATVTGTGPGGRIQLRDIEQATATPVPPPAPRQRASPMARALAAQYGLDLAAVAPSGLNGRILRRDVEAARARRQTPAPASPAQPDRATRMRQAIAAAMTRSAREIPHFHLFTTIDMRATLAWLAETNATRPVRDRLLYGALLIKAVALALRETPELNAVWAGDRAQLKPEINVGMAIFLRGGGLVAPALNRTDQLSLGEVMQRFRDLVGRARAGTLRSSDLTDPTVTVTSLGEQGAEGVVGLIYPPQVALVGFGRIVTRPWVVDGAVAPCPVLTATLSADHRVADGHRGSVFLAAIDRLLQEPDKL